MPQTAATHEKRVTAVKMLLKNHPTVGWKICLRQIRDSGRCSCTYNYKPKWRTDGHGFGEPFKSSAPISAFVGEMVELALNRPSYTVEMLSDLVSKLHLLAPEKQARVWELIDRWHNKVSNNVEILTIRETIHRTFLSRWAHKKFNEKDHADLLEKAKAVYFDLQPKDTLDRYEWLFRQGWVEELPGELEKDEMDYQAHEQRVKQLRRDALSEILRDHGVSGIFELSDKGKCQREIGGLLVSGLLTEEQINDLILQCLRPSENDSARKNLVGGALWALGDKRRKVLYERLRGRLSEGEMLRLLLLSPYQASTWKLVDQLSMEARERYWDEVVPRYIFNSREENNESVRRLLEVGRPRAAFASMDIKLEEIHPSLFAQLLFAMVKKSKDKTGEYRLDDYHVRHAFELINHNSELSLEEKAGLEFAYLEVLTPLLRLDKERHIPNLERYLEEHPELFVRAVVWAYKRDDDGEDPPEFRVADNREQWAERGLRLFESIGRIPGQDKTTKEEQREALAQWVATVRRSCAELGRADIADLCLGKLFSAAPVGEDGVWPNEAVRDVMEDLQSEYINQGAHVGLYNARGPHWCKEGGDLERDLADLYRNWADALQFTHPFVSSTLLRSMVDTYERQAEERDAEAAIRRRTMY